MPYPIPPREDVAVAPPLTDAEKAELGGLAVWRISEGLPPRTEDIVARYKRKRVSLKRIVPRTPKRNLDKLKELNRKVEQLRTATRDEAFDEWLERCTMDADDHSEWTQSTVLYENYLKRAPTYASSRGDRALLKLELATETMFGILMRDVGITKKRKAKGYFYPVRLKQGA